MDALPTDKRGHGNVTRTERIHGDPRDQYEERVRVPHRGVPRCRQLPVRQQRGRQEGSEDDHRGVGPQGPGPREVAQDHPRPRQPAATADQRGRLVRSRGACEVDERPRAPRPVQVRESELRGWQGGGHHRSREAPRRTRPHRSHGGGGQGVADAIRARPHQRDHPLAEEGRGQQPGEG